MAFFTGKKNTLKQQITIRLQKAHYWLEPLATDACH